MPKFDAVALVAAFVVGFMLIVCLFVNEEVFMTLAPMYFGIIVAISIVRLSVLWFLFEMPADELADEF